MFDLSGDVLLEDSDDVGDESVEWVVEADTEADGPHWSSGGNSKQQQPDPPSLLTKVVWVAAYR